MSSTLERVAAVVRRETGIVVRDAQMPSLAAAIRRVAPDMDLDRFACRLGDGSPEGRALMAGLVDEVTVQETYFFRERRELEAIEWRRLLGEARRSGVDSVRVWVAACATGEEAYSLAILASEALGGEGTPVSILGTDISTAALAKAEAGRGYSARSVRNLPPRLRDRYLSKEGSRFAVREEIKSLVRFRRHNLVADPMPPSGEVPFDVIACRNVLIYFEPANVEPLIRSLESALRPGGSLVLGIADRLTGTANALDRVVAAPTAAGRATRAAGRVLRRPLGVERRPPASSNGAARGRIDAAMEAADAGELERALEIVEALLAEDPLMADAYFVRGLAQLRRGDPSAAAESLRTVLYLDPYFGIAAFELGRAHDAEGKPKEAKRAYEQALRTLDAEDDRHRAIVDQVDVGDVAAACAARLRAVGAAP